MALLSTNTDTCQVSVLVSKEMQKYSYSTHFVKSDISSSLTFTAFFCRLLTFETHVRFAAVVPTLVATSERRGSIAVFSSVTVQTLKKVKCRCEKIMRQK